MRELTRSRSSAWICGARFRNSWRISVRKSGLWLLAPPLGADGWLAGRVGVVLKTVSAGSGADGGAGVGGGGAGEYLGAMACWAKRGKVGLGAAGATLGARVIMT